MKIHKLVIPTPFYIGPINIYLIDDDPLTLIDTGPKTDEALAALRQQIFATGHRVDDIKRIVLTHTHEDHCGLTGQLQNISGARVYVHEWESNRLSKTVEYDPYKRIFKKGGVPVEVIKQFEAGFKKMTELQDAVEDFETYRDGDEFVFAHGSLRAVHTPGHTTGSTCFWRESNRVVIAGDTVLKKITPNPVLFPDPIDSSRRFQSLGEYLVSCARIKDLSPTLIHTAHGDDVTDYLEHFNRTVKLANERQSKMLGMIPQSGTTAWDMSRAFFPKAEGVHTFLAFSETSAHLDFAAAEGRAKMETREGTEIFLPA